MMHLLVTDVDAWWHHVQAQESHPSTIRRPNHLKTGLGVYVTSCLLIPPASFGASGKTFLAKRKKGA